MRIVTVLSIGNSFSQDAQRYLHDLSRKGNVLIESVNLDIGGCSLEQHYQNMLGENKAYNLEVNSHSSHFMVGIKEALLARSWDYVTIQQASHYSFNENTYQPYIGELVKYIRHFCPRAKVLLHQTWGYESGSERALRYGFKTYEDMFARVKVCYEKAAMEVMADGILPCGMALSYAEQNGIKIHRDTLHASLGVGRLILALVWYGYLTNESIDTIVFQDLDEVVSKEEYQIAKEAAKVALAQHNNIK